MTTECDIKKHRYNHKGQSLKYVNKIWLTKYAQLHIEWYYEIKTNIIQDTKWWKKKRYMKTHYRLVSPKDIYIVGFALCCSFLSHPLQCLDKSVGFSNPIHVSVKSQSSLSNPCDFIDLFYF